MTPRAKSDPADSTIVLGEAEPSALYAITIAVKDPAQLPALPGNGSMPRISIFT
jgi:hypothetical protein